jgi:hypothetical protein
MATDCDDSWEGTITVDGSAVTRAKDVSFNLSRSDRDESSRVDEGFSNTKGGLATVEGSFVVQVVRGDTMFDTLRNAAAANDVVAIVFTDPAGKTISGNFSILGFDEGNPLDGANEATVTVKNAGKVTFA